LLFVHLGKDDPAGVAFSICEAINRLTEHTAINFRVVNNYIRYPCYADFNFYHPDEVRRIVLKADVLHFHTFVAPFMSVLDLRKRDVEDKVKVVEFHGSYLRAFPEDLPKLAREELGDDVLFLVSTPDLKLRFLPEAEWLPVPRDIEKLRHYFFYNRSKPKAVLDSIRRLVIVAHATTGIEKKGSKPIMRTLTELMKRKRYVKINVIIRVPWHTALQGISESDIYVDRCDLEVIETAKVGFYGAASVEAAAFEIPVLVQIGRDVEEYLKKQNIYLPFIRFDSEELLLAKLLRLVDDEELRRELGKAAYNYVKRYHDYPAVLERYFRLLGFRYKRSGHAFYY